MKSEFSTKALIYLRAAELVEQGHCKGHLYARNGSICWFHEATEFCYHGALMKAVIDAGDDTFDYKSGTWPMSRWNDAPDTTAAMVAAKLREQAFA